MSRTSLTPVTSLAGLAICVIVLVSASARGAGAAPATPVLDPTAMPRLPAEGLAIERTHDVLLVGLDGRTIGSLPGFRFPVHSGNNVVADLVRDAMGASAASPAPLVLVGPRGRAWVLAAGELQRLPPDVVPLTGGAELVGHAAPGRPGSAPRVTVSVRDARTRKRLIPVRQGDWFIDGRLLATPHVVVDLVTRERWSLAAGVTWRQEQGRNTCVPAGIAHDRVVAVCATARPGKQSYPNLIRLFSVGHDGRRELLGGPFLYNGFGAQSAFLSPDGRHVVATLAVPCGLSPSILAGTDGGKPRYIDGSTDEHQGPHTQSFVLGWSGGRVVAEFASGECLRTSPPGIYLVDPTTFARTLVYAFPPATSDFAMWSPGG